MTENELISKLQTLNQIKPNQEWVSFVKAEMFKPGIWERITEALALLNPLNRQRKLAYAFSVLLLIFGGLLSFAQYTLPGDMLFSVKEITESSQASLIGESSLSSSVGTFKKRSQDLAQVVKNNKSANIPAAVQKVKDAAKTLAQALEKDPGLAREIAMEVKDSKTLLDVTAAADLKEASDIDLLYKVIAEEMIRDLGSTQLTEEQLPVFNEAKTFFEQSKYSEALEKIFLINN